MLAWLAASAAQAAITTPSAVTAPVLLEPPASRLRYTVFALGMLPLEAQFERFSGSLRVDPARPSACRVEVTVEVASLHMDDPDRNKIALGPAMLDAARYPTMRFAGRCQGARLVGELTLHGITRRLTMSVRRAGAHVVATGMVQRRDYGIRGLYWLVGQRVQFRLDAELPHVAAAGPL
jgi:polyisoprenoid-binding protein YceI